MDAYCVTKKEASKLIGVSVRMVNYYLQRGELTVHHKEGYRSMIDVAQIYSLRERRKRG